jgi:predicted ATPase/DNA-binding CsgD family transcriptional regulator
MDASPPAVRVRQPGRLPTPPTRLFGREAEVDRVLALASEPSVRLVTLVGPGGVGKSRVALDAAYQVRDRFDGGVAFASLAPLRDGRLVLSSIARALDVPESGAEDVVADLERALADRRVLLVLDNAEHLLDQALPALVGRLLATLPGLTVLATSRAALRVYGERLVPIETLVLPENGHPANPATIAENAAIRLFLDRARAILPDFALTPANAADIVAICRRLDGLPLAIELAAARLHLLDPAELVARLHRRLDLLDGGPSDQPDRLRTLRAAIGWSYALLEPAERRHFRRLAVVPGGATLDAIAVLGGRQDDPPPPLDRPPPVPEALAGLVSKSLVVRQARPDRPARFAMLETVREFALEQLAASGEEDDARQALAEWCVRLAEGLDARFVGPDAVAILDRLDDEHDAFRSVLTWASERDDGCQDLGLRLAGALWRYWLFHNHLREGAFWLERALIQCASTAAARPAALIGAGVLATFVGQIEQAVAWLDQAVELARRDEDRFHEARALVHLGVAEAARDAMTRARPLYEAALVLFEAIGNQGYAAWTTLLIGEADVEAGRIDQGAHLVERAAALFRRLGFAWGIAEASPALATIAEARDDPGAAAGWLRDGIEIYAAHRYWLGMSRHLAQLGQLALRSGLPNDGAALLGAADALRRAIGRQGLPYNATGLTPADATDRLGEPAFAAAWQEGAAWSIEESVDRAMTVAAAIAATGLPPGRLVGGLTAREREVLCLWARGLTTKAIAEALFISPATARTHVEHIYAKLDVGTRIEAADLARAHNLC